MLETFTDFLAFKQMFLDYKAVRTAMWVAWNTVLNTTTV